MKFGGKIQSTIYLGEQGHDAADGHIHVHDFLQDLVGNLLEHLSADCRPDDYPNDAAAVGDTYGGRYKPVARPEAGHHNIPQGEIGLAVGDVLFLRFAGCQEVQYRRRALHGEQTAHNSGHNPEDNLHEVGCLQTNLLADKEEVHADGDKDAPKHMFQQFVVYVRHGPYGKETDHRKDGEDR